MNNDRTTPTATHVSHLYHPDCIACGSSHGVGLGLVFSNADGKVSATFDCDAVYQGYPDRIHGGIVALLLDEAMTHCLFSRELKGVTARLELSFRHPLRIGTPATVTAWVRNESPSYYELCGEIQQDNQLCAVGKGLFTVGATKAPKG